MSFDGSSKYVFEPMVSIIIPVYNGSNYLKEAIDSAINQSYSNIEIIVVNDGSSDDGATEKIAKSYGDRIRYFYKENGGVSSALNTGIRNMQGEYFSWLSHDDAYNVDKVKNQIDALATLENKKTIIKCATEFMDSNSHPINRKSHRKKSYFNRVFDWDEALKRMLLGSGYNGCALLIHRDVFTQCGWFDERLRYIQDWIMWINILLNKFPMLSISYYGVRSRIHSNQLTRKGSNIFKQESEVVADNLIPRLLKQTTKNYRFIFYYAKYNAKYRNNNVVHKVLRDADCFQLRFLERLSLRFVLIYGSLRAVCKSMYYRIFRRI